ncbi:60S ribosomal protein L29, partial [Durusdinium trenchii]
ARFYPGGDARSMSAVAHQARALAERERTRQQTRQGLRGEQEAGRMVKQKLHTARNQTVKAHRNNGLKKFRKDKFRSQKGMDPKFLRNLRFAKKHNNKNGAAEKKE